MHQYRAVHEVVRRAEALAEEVLLPASPAVDATSALPAANLDALADAGFYGLFAPPELGGLGADFPTMCAVVEALAAGCLTTTFVWAQHFSLLRSLLTGNSPLRDDWLGPLCRGQRRAGIAFGGLLPGPPVLRARPVDRSWVLDGVAPWVSGWGHIDAVQVAARGPADTVVHVVLDATEAGGLSATRQRLIALDATATVRVAFDGVAVPAERVLRVEPWDPAASGGATLRLNGSLALGLARRCCALLGPSALDAELAHARAALDEADGAAMPAARAAASQLALRAAGAVVVAAGSRSMVVGHPAPRLAREALFLLVFGSRAEIRTELLDRLVRVRA